MANSDDPGHNSPDADSPSRVMSAEERRKQMKEFEDMVRNTIDDRLKELRENEKGCAECRRARRVSDGEVLYCDRHRRKHYLLQKTRPLDEEE